MKIKNQFAHQGDTQWFAIDGIPTNIKKINKRFIAQSEASGSVHALYGDYDMYEHEDGFLIDCKDECILNHTLQANLTDTLDAPVVLPKKDHRHGVIPKGTYAVGIQQRFDPMENMKRRVRD